MERLRSYLTFEQCEYCDNFLRDSLSLFVGLKMVRKVFVFGLKMKMYMVKILTVSCDVSVDEKWQEKSK